MRGDPILVAGSPRFGTSLTAGLLIKHGIWAGECPPSRFDPDPQIGTENTAIKAILRTIMDRNRVHRTFPDGGWKYDPKAADSLRSEDFKNRIEEIVGTDRPWLVKTASLLYTKELWLTHFPEGRWVFVRRRLEEIEASYSRFPSSVKRNRKDVRAMVRLFWSLQDSIANRGFAHLWLDPIRLVAGDYRYAENLVRFCGLDGLSKEIFDGWVKPEKWHRA